jgi:hypothetical protein
MALPPDTKAMEPVRAQSWFLLKDSHWRRANSKEKPGWAIYAPAHYLSPAAAVLSTPPR